MPKAFRTFLVLLPLLMLMPRAAAQTAGGLISGDLRQWHRVTQTFEGAETSEAAQPNPFTDFRLLVTFTHDETRYVVPGFYAADGDAANTSADAGNRWRVHFTPDMAGVWTYTASFRTGENIAVSLDPNAGMPTAFDGASGVFAVEPTDKRPPDFRYRGVLRPVGEPYLQFAGDGSYFLKGGADSPENVLAYHEFDGTFDTGGIMPDFLHRFEPHIPDWREGDPLWAGGRGRGLIGALNYLSSQEVNSVYLITYNLDGGDGGDVWPWITPESRERFDVSKLDQWEIVFGHMTRMGIQIHLLTQETENDRALGGGDSLIRQLYYRELVARFSHHPALIWNLGEENNNTDEERITFAEYIRALDPYDHPITVHTHYNEADTFYDGLLGNPNFEATSIQGDASRYYEWALTLRQRSEAAGQPWAIFGDEQGPWPSLDMSNADALCRDAMWGNLMGGGAGIEWYFGYQDNFGDLQSEDWRMAEPLWRCARNALDFFQTHLPFWEMTPDSLIVGGETAWALAKPGELVAVFLPNGTTGSTTVDLGLTGETYRVRWYDPRLGGALQTGTVDSVQANGAAFIGQPPSQPEREWAALITREDLVTPTPPPSTPPPTLTPLPDVRVTSFTLIDANTDQPIAAFDPIADGATISLSALGVTAINVRANTDPAAVGSVRFALDSNLNFQTENVAPFALAGDTNGDYDAWSYPAGEPVILTATPYRGGNASGGVGTPLTIAFTVIP